MTYRFWGRHTDHPKYGEQFWFEAFTDETPVTKDAVCLYLQQCDGIGPATAELIWNRFGVQAIEVARETPEEIIAAVPRLTAEQCKAASELLKKKQKTERGKMDLMALVHKCGVPKRIVDKALDTWGVNAAERIRRNPYLLMKFRGIGFLKTDRMWLDFGHNPLRLKRQALACWYSIARDSEGHTWFPIYAARDFLRRHISSANVEFGAAMELATRAGMLQTREVGGQTFIAEKVRAENEGRVARLIEEARIESRDHGTSWPSVDDIPELSGDEGQHQREELRDALNGVVSFLAGSPGTGKTFTAAALIKTIMRVYPTALISAAAPTGKAAVRLTESLDKCGVKLAAKTVHSLLGVKANGDDGFGFNHDAKNPLPHKFVLIDEASMIDTPLMASLLAARPMGGHYLILGDPNQLAPVGYGAPLRDVLCCTESVTSGVLSEIRRNSGRGVQVCAAIRDRKPWQPSKKLDLDAGENLQIINTETPDQQIDMLGTLIRSFRDKSPRKYDPIWDVQVICAVNKKGPLCRRVLNPLLQDLLNPFTECSAAEARFQPRGFGLKDCPFRVGDKIVNQKNGLLKSGDPNNDDCDQDGRVYVANGEQAEVIAVEPGVITAKMTSPTRTVLIYRKGKSDSQKSAEDAAGREEPEGGEGGSEESDSSNTGCSWDLGYAISAHKSQGSEWPVVIVVLDTDNAAKRTCSRQWLYTAISRFKDFAMLIGTKKTADAMCQRDALFSRKTFLKERIEELKRETDEAERPIPVADELPEAEELPDAEPLEEMSAVFDLDELLEGVL
jgi:exodeoxyribonuclease V alpha subunit